jgi:hypothetical protein
VSRAPPNETTPHRLPLLATAVVGLIATDRTVIVGRGIKFNFHPLLFRTD